MYNAIIILIVIISVLLVVVILAQNSKGGLSSQFGGGGVSQMFGAKKTTDILERLTWGFAFALILLSMGTNFFVDKNQTGSTIDSPNIKKAQEKKTTAPQIQQPVTPENDNNTNSDPVPSDSAK